MSSLLGFQLERDDPRALYEQLGDRLAASISEGALGIGSRLPSTRAVADELGVNRNTVVAAYRRLESEGYIEQRVGSGSYVLDPATREVSQPVTVGGLGTGSRRLQKFERHSRERGVPPAAADAVDLAGIAPDERGFPIEALRECLDRVLEERGGEVLGYGPVAGEPVLREAIAERLQRRGLDIAANELVVVGGAQQGLDLLLRALSDPGDTVVVESPTYHYALDLMRFNSLELKSVPIVPGTEGLAGLDFERLDDVLTRHRPGLLYTMPTYQNPTGLSLDRESRERLLAACAASGTLIIEDDYEAELRYEGEALPPLAALGGKDNVAYVGTLSKALFPGVRVGYVAAGPDVLNKLAQAKRLSDLSGSGLLQAAVAELLKSGAFQSHLDRVVTENRERLSSLRESLERNLPGTCRVTAPLGGHALWVTLPGHVSGRELAEVAAEHGVLVSPGDLFEASGGDVAGLRLSWARVALEEVEKGAAALAAALSEVEGRRGDPTSTIERMDSPLRI